jgi:hypothetical protein
LIWDYFNIELAIQNKELTHCIYITTKLQYGAWTYNGGKLNLKINNSEEIGPSDLEQKFVVEFL